MDREFRRVFAIGRSGVEVLEGRIVLSTIEVTSLADSGTGTLRAAILQADQAPDSDTINFAPGLTGTITLLSALPDLKYTLAIDGPGASELTLAGSGLNVPVGANVSIGGLSVTKGGISNAGTMPVTDCNLSHNAAGLIYGSTGGGISNTGTMTVKNSTVSSNSADDGGGIFNSGTMAVANSIISDNIAVRSPVPSNFDPYYGPGQGGGISNVGTIVIFGTTIRGNSAESGYSNYLPSNLPCYGGGISNSGTISIANSTLSSNSASDGGGISNSGKLTVSNSTISKNDANGNNLDFETTVAGYGGGILNSGTLSLTFTTVSGNSAIPGRETSSGGGVFNSGNTPVMTVTNSIIAGNHSSIGTDVTGGDTGTQSLGFNLIGITDGSKGWIPTDLTGTATAPLNPLLGPLANNGGPTQTMALLPGSPARGAGVSVPGVTTDQRGYPRSSGATPDIGAFQVAPPQVVNVIRTGIYLQPTHIVVRFSSSLDASTATNVNNYSIVRVEPDGKANHHSLTIPFASAVFNPKKNTVTLTPTHRLNLHYFYRLTVNGKAPGGVAATDGTLLDGNGNGQPGSDYVTVIHRFGTANVSTRGVHPSGPTRLLHRSSYKAPATHGFADHRTH